MSRRLFVTTLTASAVAVTLAAGSTARANSYEGNLYSPTYQHEYRHGVVPMIETWQKMQAWAKFNPDFAATSPNTLRFNGGIDGGPTTPIGVISLTRSCSAVGLQSNTGAAQAPVFLGMGGPLAATEAVS